MAKSRYINTKFWSDGFVSDLNPLDRYLFLYFLTNEHTNICGVYELPLKKIAFETGLEIEMLKKMMRKLSGKIEYLDGWVFIVNFKKHLSNNPKVAIGITIAENAIPAHVKAKIDSLSIGYAYALNNTDSDINPNSDYDQKPPKGECEGFLKFWFEYPKKVAKPKALLAFRKVKHTEHEKMLSALNTQKLSEAWLKDSGQFIPHPATWINQRRWEDELKIDQAPKQDFVRGRITLT